MFTLLLFLILLLLLFSDSVHWDDFAVFMESESGNFAVCVDGISAAMVTFLL